MKGREIVLFLFLFFSFSHTSSPRTITCPFNLTDLENVIPGEFIVRYHPNHTVDENHLQRRGHDTLHVFNHAFHGRAIRTENIDDLLWDKNIVDIECNLILRADCKSWGLDRINQWKLPLDGRCKFKHYGKGVTIYIVDTGVSSTHDELSGRVETGKNFLDQGGPTDTADLDGHGTFVASIAMGATRGVAREANVFPVRVLNREATGSLSNAIAAINFIASRGILPAVAVLSLGSATSSSFNTAVESAVDAGVVFVVSAGNDGKNACEKSPASAPSAIAVGASTMDDKKAARSNYGPCVTVYAPGELVPGASIVGDSAYGEKSGTSFAAPYVAGVVALLLGADPNLTPPQVRDLLEVKYSAPLPCHCTPDRIVFSCDL